MKVYVKLALHGEYHGYDIYCGVFKTIEEAIDSEKFNLAYYGDKLGMITLRHKDEEEYADPTYAKVHTHVVFYDKEYGEPTEEDFEAALKYQDEDEFYDYGYKIIRSITIEEEEL